MRRNSLAGIPYGLPHHIWSSHKIFFLDPPLPPSSVNSIALNLDDIDNFRSVVERLPLANKAKIITGIQMVRALVHGASIRVFQNIDTYIALLSALTDAR
jgi:hypothetical protein